MTRTKSIALALALTAMLPLSGLAQSTSATADAAGTKKEFPLHIKLVDTTITAKVVELDRPNRLATFRTLDNDFVTVRVPHRLKNFDQVQVGDDLVVHYTVAAAARINPATKDGIRETIETATTAGARPGAMPGVIAKNSVQVLANILSFDTRARTVTIQGATRTVTITVPDGFDMKKLAVGDQVEAEFSDAVAIDIQRPVAR